MQSFFGHQIKMWIETTSSQGVRERLGNLGKAGSEGKHLMVAYRSASEELIAQFPDLTPHLTQLLVDASDTDEIFEQMAQDAHEHYEALSAEDPIKRAQIGFQGGILRTFMHKDLRYQIMTEIRTGYLPGFIDEEGAIESAAPVHFDFDDLEEFWATGRMGMVCDV